MSLKSPLELMESFKNELQSQAPELTDDSEGSLVDILSGVAGLAVSEIQQKGVEEYRKTFFSTANGPEVTGGPDDLQTLATDHFGDSFKRPGAEKSTGTVTFERPNSGAGNCIIPAGTVVKSPSNEAGKSQRFETTAQVTMVGTSVEASVRAIIAGTEGNVQANQVTQIESTLTDSSITVSNAAVFTGGQGGEDDSEYRETIRRLLSSLKGATKAALENAALNVAGVANAKAIEFLTYVKEWDIAEEETVGDYFAIARTRIYISDSEGGASQTLIDDVQAVIDVLRATGVKIPVIGTEAVSQNFTLALTLNPSGPNFATLQQDTSMVTDEMRKYIQDLAIGSDFIRALAKAYILAKFGPSGTNDLTAVTVTVPAGDVAAGDNQKLVPGTIATV